MGDPSVAMIGAYAAGGCVIIGAVAAGIVSIITAWRTVAGKVNAIEAHVNSEKTMLQERALAKDREVELLREMLVDKRQSASLLAQAASHEVAAKASPKETTPTPVEVVNTPLAVISKAGSDSPNEGR